VLIALARSGAFGHGTGAQSLVRKYGAYVSFCPAGTEAVGSGVARRRGFVPVGGDTSPWLVKIGGHQGAVG